MLRRSPVIFFLILITLCSQAQTPALPKYYFRNPLNLPIKLTANFGELRPNHWHMGLDIRTNQKENQPVYAAADGYIAHVGVRPQSFGRYIIINHPNGYSTLYAHLNDFFPALEQYVTNEQYKKETWAIELDFTPKMFPVFRSQFIAFSGTTGGSQGPHLHFETRDTKTDRCINPLLLGMPVPDNVPPDLVKLAMYDRSKSIFEQSPLFFPIKNTDSGWVIPKMPVIKTGLKRLSFSIQAYDRASGSTNPNGIYSAKLYMDDEPLIGFQLDSLDYKETVYVNAQIDYKNRFDGGSFLQHLSRLPGDHGPEYRTNKNDGILTLSDTAIHAISIEIKDADFNVSVFSFGLQYDDSLRKTKTDSEKIITSNQSAVFIPDKTNSFEKTDFKISLAEDALYDSVHVVYYRLDAGSPYAVTALHQVNDASIPIHSYLNVEIKPNRDIPLELKNKILLVRHDQNGNSARKAVWKEDGTGVSWLTSRFEDFGAYQGFIDTIPPDINDPNPGEKLAISGDTLDMSPATQISLDIHDNFGSIRNFRAEIDGKWIRFTNDKNLSFIYKFDDHCPFGNHELKVSVEDLVGNVATKQWLFKRNPYTPPKKIVKKKKSLKKKSH